MIYEWVKMWEITCQVQCTWSHAPQKPCSRNVKPAGDTFPIKPVVNINLPTIRNTSTPMVHPRNAWCDPTKSSLKCWSWALYPFRIWCSWNSICHLLRKFVLRLMDQTLVPSWTVNAGSSAHSSGKITCFEPSPFDKREWPDLQQSLG